MFAETMTTLENLGRRFSRPAAFRPANSHDRPAERSRIHGRQVKLGEGIEAGSRTVDGTPNTFEWRVRSFVTAGLFRLSISIRRNARHSRDGRSGRADCRQAISALHAGRSAWGR